MKLFSKITARVFSGVLASVLAPTLMQSQSIPNPGDKVAKELAKQAFKHYGDQVRSLADALNKQADQVDADCEA